MDLSRQRVLVTGGTGFLGRHLTRELAAAGAEVVGVGRADGDLRQATAIRGLLERVAPDAVVHLAAVVGGIGANRRRPGRFFYDNAIMGIELLEACRLREVAKVLVVGTACSYPGEAPTPTRESQLWDGYPEPTNAPYGLAKRMLLVQAQAYRQEYGTNIVYLIPTNLYGPGDNFDLDTGHVIPGLIRRFQEARDAGRPEVVLWGDGSPTRDFLHVTDGARACRLALARYDGAEPVNVSSGSEISIRDLADLLAGLTGFTGAIRWDTSQPNGQARRRLDPARAGDALGFTPAVALEDGLRQLVASYQRPTEPA
jgi:GDP-L-fucose synthase